MKQVTLVALYGQKKQNFIDLINAIFSEIEASELGGIFKRYNMNQIHGTLVGMEKVDGFEELYNFNIWEKEERKVEMDFANLYPTIAPFFPVDIQLGGFKEDYRGFSSLGGIPFNRTFEINWTSNKIILIGWSMDEGKKVANRKLEILRQTLHDRHNIRPKMDKDNDLYMVIGELKNVGLLSEEALDRLKKAGKKLEKSIRTKLAENKEELILTMEDLFFVQYESTTLDFNSSEAWNIQEAKNNPDFLKELY